MSPRRFERYVAIGDSTTEGIDDPDGAGSYRGWADRFAEHVAAHQAAHGGTLAYANLAIRGRVTRQIRDEQLGPALALEPDLATVVAGMNDLLRGGFDARRIADDLGDMQRQLISRGAVVLTMTIPDIARRLTIGPIARLLSGRVRALNAELRRVSAEAGAIVVDFAAYPLSVDPRMWSHDRLHVNTGGHARIAVALAQALGLPGFDHRWLDPLPDAPAIGLGSRLAEQARWSRDFFAPWLWRRLRGVTAGDDRTAKRPALTPVVPPR